MPVSLRQEINDHGPPFQYDLPSEIISRESHGETEVNVPQEVAEPRFPLATNLNIPPRKLLRTRVRGLIIPEN